MDVVSRVTLLVECLQFSPAGAGWGRKKEERVVLHKCHKWFFGCVFVLLALGQRNLSASRLVKDKHIQVSTFFVLSFQEKNRCL